MNIIRTKSPDKNQIKNLLCLQNTCQDHDQISLTFPMEENCIYYLLYENDRLLSALCAFFNESGDLECSGFTLPSKRKQGFFALLLKELLKESEDKDIIFPADESCLDTMCTLRALEASFWYREHFMEITLSGFLDSEFKKNNKTREVHGLTMEPAGSDQYGFFIDGTRIGSFSFNEQGDKSYFYGFEIREELRRKGLGTACLLLFLEAFFRQPEKGGSRILFLQVSGLNKPAIALYKKAGFHITESLSYYVY